MPKSYKHSNEKRAHIPSKEEAGYETGNPVVQEKLEKPILRNPITERGADPELFWLNKYGTQDDETHSLVDIRSLYRVEHVSPELLIKRFYRNTPPAIRDLFGNSLEMDELDKPMSYYSHQDDWQNRLIQGDSLLVMSSLLEREGMAGKVQMIYIDPPYGIKYGSNWQMKLNDRNVKDGDDEALSGEPEQIRAFRDTWELGIHSYLSYLRDRLIVARELLTESGSCFVQISDENVHLVRCLMDEVFGSGNFVCQIGFRTTMTKPTNYLNNVFDYLLWYAKDKNKLKFMPLYIEREDKDGYKIQDLVASSLQTKYQFVYEGKTYNPQNGWRVSEQTLERLAKTGRIHISKNALGYKRFYSDFPYFQLDNMWNSQMSENQKIYVVQTSTTAVQRCLLMTTDPGDLVLDPTCGSGTTAYVAEQWGRRWITIDTSRIAINIAKTRLMTASYDYYKLKNDRDLTEGFIYKTVPHVTLKSLANDEPPDTETLYDQPEIDRKVIRIAGEFTVETLQSYEPVLPTELVKQSETEGREHFENLIFDHLKTAGIKNSLKDEMAKFIRVESLAHAYLHAEGFYNTDKGERKAYVHIGDKFSAVSKRAVNEAIKECRARGDADWLIILGFAFESDISNQTITQSAGSFEVTKVRMHDDLLQEGLRKKDKKAGSFITIGEIDVVVRGQGSGVGGQWVVDRNGKEICLYDDFKILSGVVSLAEINGLGGENLSDQQTFSKGGTVCPDSTNAPISDKYSIEHRRGAITQLQQRIHSILGDSERFSRGTGNAIGNILAPALSRNDAISANIRTMQRNRTDAEWLTILDKIKNLTPDHCPLTPDPRPLIIEIRGLDIYDPIKDEVRPRDLHHIAYWMLDDDYDGSNFVVKQIFFCGGDKQEFKNWKKGLENLAVGKTRKNVQNTLKIEIEEEAFERIYGYQSHPITIKPGQKIAVKAVTHFGEESFKIIGDLP